MMKTTKNNKILAAIIWASITLFYCYQSVLRPLPNIIMPFILSKYNIGAAEFGSFAGIYYIGYIAVHIPIGVLLSRFSPKIVLSVCVACTALGVLPLIYSDSWSAVVIGRILTGVGSSGAAVGALQIFRVLYPSRFAMLLGVMVSIGLIVAVYVNIFLSKIISTIGVDSTMNILLYSGLGLSVMTYLFLPSSKSEASEGSIWGDIKAILGDYKILLASACAGLMVGPMEGFADAWGSAFLISMYNLDKTAADAIIMSIFFGMCVGCIILPYFADKTQKFMEITIFSGIMMALCFVYLLQGTAREEELSYICIAIGFFCAYQIIILAKISTFASEERSGLAAAVANMILMTFGWVFHNSIGMTLDSMWDGTTINGVRYYDSEAFVAGVSIIPLAMVVAIAGLVFLSILNAAKARKKRKKSNLNLA